MNKAGCVRLLSDRAAGFGGRRRWSYLCYVLYSQMHHLMTTNIFAAFDVPCAWC